jgi:hypothetical protein
MGGEEVLIMPSSLWGYEHRDTVEVWDEDADCWIMGFVSGFTMRREVLVTTDVGTFVIDLPTRIRKWERPSTPDAIEEFLNR